jgi:UDP-glucose 4-epimerase
MFNNLVANKHHFSKMITFGSGIEVSNEDSPYANSKREIAKKIQILDNFYNLRIFGVFDENELFTRFIKANIIRSVKNEPMIIHSNKIMDFFYMEDLISLINHYIENDGNKEIDCCYNKKYTLKDVADIINKIAKHKVEIVIQNDEFMSPYCGHSASLPINEVGLVRGVEKTYYKIARSMLTSSRDMVQLNRLTKDCL